MAFTSPTAINGTAGFDSIFPYLSEITNFWFGRMLMIAIFFLFFMGYFKARENDIIGGLAVASYVTFVLGLIFWVLGLVTGIDFAIIIGITVASSVALLKQKKEY